MSVSLLLEPCHNRKLLEQSLKSMDFFEASKITTEVGIVWERADCCEKHATAF